MRVDDEFGAMEVEAFRDALAKGQGRTMFALRAPGGPARYGEALIAGCVKDLRYRVFFETERGPYLYRLLEAAGLREEALAQVLRQLPVPERKVDREQMLGLLAEYAERGDERAWNALLQEASTGEYWACVNVAGLGPRGLDWLAENVVPRLAIDDWSQLHVWLPDDAAEDTTPTEHRLRAMHEEWRTYIKGYKREDTWGKLPTRSFLQHLSDEKKPPITPFEFARRATRAEGKIAAERLLNETDERVLKRLVEVFKHWDYPLPVRRLFAQATHPQRGGAICEVLGTIDSPAVRHFGRGLLKRRPIPWNALGALFESVYQGDEAMIAAALPEMATYSERYRGSTTSDLLRLLREFPKAAWQPHAEWIYENSPKARWRSRAVAWMMNHGTLPQHMREEGAFDAEPETRELCGAEDPGTV